MSGDFQFGDRITQYGNGNIGKITGSGQSGGPPGRGRGHTGQDSPAASAPGGGRGGGRAPETLSQTEAKALAAAFGAGPEARLLLVAAGLPPDRVPTSSADASLFWAAVSELLANGVLIDGRRRVLAAAAARFPANPYFAADDD